MEEAIYHKDYILENEEREEVLNLLEGECINTSIFDLTFSRIWKELIYILQDLSILSYNKLKLLKYSKSRGKTEIIIDSSVIDDNALSDECSVIEDYLIDKFERIVRVEFNRVPNSWELIIEESLG